jgi:hypothetical protein
MEEVIMRHVRHSQLGVALLLILTMIIVGAASMILYKLNHVNFQTANQENTVQALAQAKDALIGFAMTYAEHHPGQPQGYLLCPDTDGDGSADPPCGNLGVSALGRLPWKTLGLPVLRDGSGECLWYAVSGNYKDNPKQTLTTDTPSSYGLFVVKDATGATIAGTTAADQAIAIIFAPGRKIGTQLREATGTRTVCGSDNAADAINQAANYLDSLNGINNAISPPSPPSPPSPFISAPVTKQANDPSQVLFNDTLMLITPKDFEPVYKRMNRWVATQVERCLEKYPNSNRYRNSLMTNHEDIIGKWDTLTPTSGTYRDKHKNEIEKYIADQLALQLNKYIKDYPDQHDGQAPSTQEIEAEKQAEATKEATDHTIRKKALAVTDKYPWASPVSNIVPPYSDVSDKRFGRIPADLTYTITDNPDMPSSWPPDSPTGMPGVSPLSCGTPICFDENQSTDPARCTVNCVTKCPNVCNNYCNGDSDCQADCLLDCQADCLPGRRDKSWYWWWWKEWKEMVFYAVDDDNSPSTLTKIWVREQQDSTIEVLPNPIPSTIPSNTLKLDNTNAQIVVLVAGRKSSTPTPPTPPTQTQTRNSIAATGNAWNYLEGGNEIVGNEYFVSKQSTPIPIPPPIQFNDVVCSNNTCPLP